MTEEIPDHLSQEDLMFGSSDPFLPGITFFIPNLYGTSKEFQGWLLEYLAMDDARIQYTTSIEFLSSNDDNWERFLALSLGTAGIHELRHFHEFYASPFGARILSILIINALSFPVIQQVLQNEKTLAIPISTWAKLPPELHTRYEMQTKSRSLSEKPPSGAATLAMASEAGINEIKRLYASSKLSDRFGFSTRHFLEASAISVQFEAISMIFGPATLKFFKAMLTIYDKQNEYDRLASIWPLVGKNAILSPIVRNAIILFALCGEWWATASHQYNHPGDRLLGVALIAHRNGSNPDESNVLEFLAQCAEEMNTPTLEESLRHSVRWFEDFTRDIKSATLDAVFIPLGLVKSRQKYIKCLDELAASHRYMVETILQDPISFFAPDRYILKAQDWLAAPRWYRSNTYFYSPSNPLLNLKKESGESDWLVPGFLTVEDDDSMYAPLLLSKFTTNGKEIMSPESAYHFGIDNYLGNVFWTKGFPNPFDEKIAFWHLQNLLPEKELILLRV